MTRLLYTSYKDHITNDAVHNKIQAAIAPYEDLSSSVKKRKLGWYGHVARKGQGKGKANENMGG